MQDGHGEIVTVGVDIWRKVKVVWMEQGLPEVKIFVISLVYSKGPNLVKSKRSNGSRHEEFDLRTIVASLMCYSVHLYSLEGFTVIMNS